jgi:hypothetical protein
MGAKLFGARVKRVRPGNTFPHNRRQWAIHHHRLTTRIRPVDRCNKAIASSGDIDKEPVAVPTIAERTTQGDVGPLFALADMKQSIDTVKAGLNYRFDYW